MAQTSLEMKPMSFINLEDEARATAARCIWWNVVCLNSGKGGEFKRQVDVGFLTAGLMAIFAKRNLNGTHG
jgi:hypothetical protein